MILSKLHISSLAVKVTSGLLVTVFLYKLLRSVRKRSKPPPPGPSSWPILGYIGILAPNMCHKFEELGKKFGNVFSFYLGSRLTVVLNDYKAIKAAFVDQSITFAGRPIPWVLKSVDVVEEINNGTYTEEWIANKKLFLQALRQFGSMKGLDEKIQYEIETLMSIYRNKNSAPFNPRDHLNRAMANLIFSILIDQSYSYDSPLLQEKLDIITSWQGTVAEANILDLFPFLRFLPFKPIERLRKVAKRMKTLYEKDVTLHKETYNRNELRDVIDVFLKEKGLDYDNQRLIGLFVGLAGDAADTLPETMVWMVLYLAHFPQAQEKIRKEVEAFSVPVKITNKSDLRYTEAFVLEVLRLSSFVPITEPHTTLEDTTLNGYHIPKDSLVLGNLYAAHMDRTYWGDPENFRPERFLDDNSEIIRHEAFMPFSVGRRTCIGNQLCMKVLVLYTSCLMQQFSLAFPDGSPGLEPPPGYNRKAKQLLVTATPRE